MSDVEKEILESLITEEEIHKAIQHMKNGKSPGVDNILTEMLKSCEYQIMTFLVALFNKLFRSGCFPFVWSKAIIVPLHRKGDVNNSDNYLGISLLSSLGKIYTCVLNDRLTKWANIMDKVSETQAGFRQGYSVVENIFTLYAIIEKNLCKRRKKLCV